MSNYLTVRRSDSIFKILKSLSGGGGRVDNIVTKSVIKRLNKSKKIICTPEGYL